MATPSNPSTRTSPNDVGIVLITPDIPEGTTVLNYLFCVVDLPVPTNGDSYTFGTPVFDLPSNTVNYTFTYNSQWGYAGNPVAPGANMQTYMLPPFLNSASLPSPLPPIINVKISGNIQTIATTIVNNQYSGSNTPSANPIIKTGQVSTLTTVRIYYNEVEDLSVPVAWVPRPYLISSFTKPLQNFIVYLTLTGAEGFTNILNSSTITISINGVASQAILYTPNTTAPGPAQTAAGWIACTQNQYTNIFGSGAPGTGTMLVSLSGLNAQPL